MSESKTYVFGNEGSGQGGMMSLLAPLLQQRGLDPNQKDGFVFNRFYADCCHNGMPIPWEDLL